MRQNGGAGLNYWEHTSMMSDQQREEFEAVTRPVIEWLNKNCHPHVTAVIDTTHAQLSESIIAYATLDYVRD